MERLLVTGVDGPLGGNLALALADRFEVLGLYGQAAVEAATCRAMPCPSAASQRISLVEEFRPHWILLCSPLAAPSWDHPKMSGEDTAEIEWWQIARNVAARLAVVSSDIVFAGPRMFHDEESAAESPATRAVAVRAFERSLQGTGTLVVRTHAYGWSPAPCHAGFAELAAEALAFGRDDTADGNRYATPILATDLAELLVRAYAMRLEGLYHISGAERASCNRFVATLAAAMDLDWNPAMAEAIAPLARPWHDETSLSSKRARRTLEMATPMLQEGVERFVAQGRNGWRDQWHVVEPSVGNILAA